MIKLNISLLDTPIVIDGPLYFVIKNQPYFTKVVQELYRIDETNDIKLFDSKYNNLKSNDMILITDILRFDVNSSSIIKLIYTDLENQLNIDIETKTKIEFLTNQITTIISDELVDHNLDLIMDEITILELFKSLGIKIDVEQGSIFQKILTIIEVYKYLNKKKCLVFINVSVYLSINEMKSLLEFISLNQGDVLFIERYEMKGFSNYILDEDFYFYKN